MSSSQKQRVILLGSTGSIGENTLLVIENLKDDFEVVGLAAGKRGERVCEQAAAFGVEHIAIASEAAAEKAREANPQLTVYSGEESALELVHALEADFLIAAVVGAAGLPATLAAIDKGMNIGLANKETLVAAGELVMPRVKAKRVELLPIDSEHSAIFQCLQTVAGMADQKSIKRIVLTASGGPFRTASKKAIENATVAEALNHPTWNMGRKITIDSASMMNKALEIIEAHWLFDLTAEQIGVIIHPQSIAHSFVEFTDHSILAQMGEPDMKTPIQYALTHPHRSPGVSQPFDWTALSNLIFEQPDFERFPALKLAFRVVREGGTSGAVLNAANEVAVEAFLNEEIQFGQIVQLVEQAMDAIENVPVDSLTTVLTADQAARDYVQKVLNRGFAENVQ